METKTLAVLGIVALVAASIPVLADVQGEPSLSATLSDDQLTAGNETRLEFTIQNRGEIDETDDPSLHEEVTTARGVTASLDSGDAPLEVRSGTSAVGTIRNGEAVRVPFRVVVDDDADPGTYEVEIELEYRYTSSASPDGSDYEEETETVTRDVEVTIEEQPRFAVEDVSSDVPVGDSGPVTVELTNTGDADATDASVVIASNNAGVTIAGGEESSAFVGDWEAGESREVTFDARAGEDVNTETYRFTAAVEYTDADGQDARSRDRSFGVPVLAEQTFATENVTADLRVGEEGTLRGTLVNTGETTAENVLLRFETENPNVNVIEPEYGVGTLEAGERAEFAFEPEISDGARAGPRQFSLEADYRTSEGTRRVADPLDLTVPVEQKRSEFAVDGVETTFQVGDDGRLVLDVTNNRNVTLEDISAKLFVESPLSVSDDEAFVSSLEPGETEQLVFGVGVGDGALEKTYPVQIDFQYEDATGTTRLSEQYSVPVAVSGEGGSRLLSFVVGGLIIGGVAVAGGYVYRRQR
ncbi:COG1361 S-layer family protein [Haloferacaceae archaeon DSL9]